MPNWMAPFKADEVVFLYVVSPEESTLRWPIFLTGMTEAEGPSDTVALLIPDAAAVPAGAPASRDENPAAAGPEEADAILAAPSPSAASLPFNPAFPFLGIESSPRLFTEPAFGGLLTGVVQAPGQAQDRTTCPAWGRAVASHLPSNLNCSPPKLPSLTRQEHSSRAPGVPRLG